MKPIDVPGRLYHHERPALHSNAISHTGQWWILRKRSLNWQLGNYSQIVLCKFQQFLWNCHFLFILIVNIFWASNKNIALPPPTKFRMKWSNGGLWNHINEKEIPFSKGTFILLSESFEFPTTNATKVYPIWLKNRSCFYSRRWRSSLGEPLPPFMPLFCHPVSVRLHSPLFSNTSAEGMMSRGNKW